MKIPSHQRKGRRGAAAVEAAVVLPIMVFLMIGLVLGGVGVFHYQQVAHLAREATRWTGARGSEWAKETEQTSPSAKEIRTQAIDPGAVSLDAAKLTVNVYWVNGDSGDVKDWDSSPKTTRTLTKSGNAVPNRVRVTIGYDYLEAGLFGAVRLTTTSEAPMLY